MKRERATSLLVEMIDRLEVGAWPLGLVEEVYVFGSYVRGSLTPNDADVVVQHGTDRKWLDESVYASSYGKDSYTSMKQGLRGNRPGVSFQFGERDTLRAEGFELTLLWQRGEPFDLARQRLAAMTPDPTAEPAPRDHMLPQFEGIEHRVPRPARIELHQLHTAGKITITAVQLPDAEPADPHVRRHFERRWTNTSPLRRAAGAALAHLETRHVDLSGVQLHNRQLVYDTVEVTHFVDLGWHYFRAMTRHLRHGRVWLEVLNPLTSKPAAGLQITPASPTSARVTGSSSGEVRQDG